jgi:DNA-binding CsgD family transcriptional regulator
VPAYAQTHGLSRREREVLALVIEGKDNRTIAQELFLSEGTIKTHVHNIMVKTNTRNRNELKQSFWAS